MTANHIFRRSHPRREKATRRAFFVWMAAYAVALVIVAMAHTLGGAPVGTTLDASDVQTQQAKVAGQPQSSIAGRELPQVVSFDIDG